MWICKIKVNGHRAVIGNLSKECGVSGSGYPSYSVRRGDNVHVNFILFMFGPEENKQEFFRRMRESPRIINFEDKGHCAMGEIVESLEHGHLYNYNVFHVEPVKTAGDGYEVWTVAAWKKDELMSFIKSVEKDGFELLKIGEENISNLSVLTLHPELTGSQRRAIELAIENKYYDIPRRIQLEELAALMGVSYSTYQAHLRKAEKKLLPFFFERS